LTANKKGHVKLTRSGHREWVERRGQWERAHGWAGQARGAGQVRRDRARAFRGRAALLRIRQRPPKSAAQSERNVRRRAPARTEAVGRDLARWTRSTTRPSEVRGEVKRRGGAGVGVEVVESEPSSPSLRSPSHTVRQPFTRARASRGRRRCSQGYGDRQREKRASARNVGCGAGGELGAWRWG
jgi:hypothetical protein